MGGDSLSTGRGERPGASDPWGDPETVQDHCRGITGGRSRGCLDSGCGYLFRIFDVGSCLDHTGRHRCTSPNLWKLGIESRYLSEGAGLFRLYDRGRFEGVVRQLCAASGLGN